MDLAQLYGVHIYFHIFIYELAKCHSSELSFSQYSVLLSLEDSHFSELLSPTMADANASMSSLTDSDRCATAFRLVLQLIEAPDVTFDNRIGVLNKIKETWERNEDVVVIAVNELAEQVVGATRMESRKANLTNPPMPVLDCYQLFDKSGGEIEQSRNEPKRNESADKRENIQAEGMKGRLIQVETPMAGTSSGATRLINGNSAPETCEQPGEFGADGQIHHQYSQQQASQGQEVLPITYRGEIITPSDSHSTTGGRQLNPRTFIGATSSREAAHAAHKEDLSSSVDGSDSHACGTQTEEELRNYLGTHTSRSSPNRSKSRKHLCTTNLISKKYKQLNKCDVCAKTFLTRQGFKRHRQSHECKTCSKTVRDMARHLRVHTGEKPHHCQICRKRFKELSSLKKHWVKVHRRKLYKGRHCSKTFFGQCALKRHEKEYHCGDNEQTGRPYPAAKGKARAAPSGRRESDGPSCSQSIQNTDRPQRNPHNVQKSKRVPNHPKGQLKAAPLQGKTAPSRETMKEHVRGHSAKQHPTKSSSPATTGKDVIESSSEEESNLTDEADGDWIPIANPTNRRSGSKSTLQCKFCGRHLSSNSRLREHENCHKEKKKSFLCRDCNGVYFSGPTFSAHLEQKHKNYKVSQEGKIS